MAFRPFQRLGLKIVSVMRAALIWLIVSGEQIVERGFRIPLEFSNLPVGLELASDAPTVCSRAKRHGLLKKCAPAVRRKNQRHLRKVKCRFGGARPPALCSGPRVRCALTN